MLIELFLRNGYNLIVMIMDGIIGIIMIFSISRGKRKGFSDTFVKVILLAVAIFAGAFFTGNFNRLLKFVHLDKLINSRLSINLENADFDLADNNDIYRTGVIGQFNLTIELAWKALQEIKEN